VQEIGIDGSSGLVQVWGCFLGSYEALVAGMIELDQARYFPKSLGVTHAAAGNLVLTGTLRRGILTYQPVCISRLSNKKQ